MARVQVFLLFCLFGGLVFMHVNGYENRARRHFEALPDQSETEISESEPLWFRNDHSPITKVTASRCLVKTDCITVTIDLQDKADFIITQRTIIKLTLTPENPEQESGPFIVRLIHNKAVIAWHSSQTQRGYRTNQKITAAEAH